MRNFTGTTTTVASLKSYATKAGLTVQELGPLEINKHVLKLYEGDVCHGCFKLRGASVGSQGIRMATAIYEPYWLRKQEEVVS